MTTEQTTTVTIAGEYDDLAPLCNQYPGQNSPQPAHIELTQDGDLSADWSPEIGNARPMDVYLAQRLWWDVAPALSGPSVAWLLRQIVPLAERVLAGWTTDWDGNNIIGQLDDDAGAASDEIDRLCREISDDDGAMAVIYDTRDWLLGDNGASEWSADITDAQISEMATEMRAVAVGEGHVIEWDGVMLDDVLRNWRDAQLAEREA